MTDTDPIPYDQDDDPEVWPPHTGEGPDVSNLGNERETEPDRPSENQLALGRYLAKCGNSNLSGFW